MFGRRPLRRPLEAHAGPGGKTRRLGVHVSIAGGFPSALRRAKDLGCSTAQIFSHNPRAWALKPIPAEEALLFKALRERLDISPVYVHASYLLNISAGGDALREKLARMLGEEMARADVLGADYVVLHARGAPGAEARRGAASIRRAVGGRGFRAGLLLENTAGGKGLEAVSQMAEGAGGLVAGLCIDTCHAFASGYDIRDEAETARLAEEIEVRFGPGAVRLVHLNDSKGQAGSGIDRHEHIGMGKIGAAALGAFVNHRTFSGAPVILETPKESDADDHANLGRAGAMFKRNNLKR